LKWSQQARRSSGTLWKQRWVEASCENLHTYILSEVPHSSKQHTPNENYAQVSFEGGKSVYESSSP